jgi:two-component system, NarL family, sensor histidine kinase YdfH
VGVLEIFKTNPEVQDKAKDQLLITRFPILLWVSLVYVASMILQNFNEFFWVNSLTFTTLYVIHGFLHLNLSRISISKSWLYFLIQGLLIFTCALLMPIGSPATLIGLLPVLIAQSIGLYYQILRRAFVSIYCAIVFLYTFLYLDNNYDVLLMVALYILMLIVVVAYALLFFGQVHARIRTQAFLEDLENAHKKVEELTLANERQRMARDLHDTLAQGVAGLIMQLEAVDAYISQGNIRRSQEFLQISLSQARRTLAEARLAIDNLRLKSASTMDFHEAIIDVIQRFIQATGIQVFPQFELISPLTGTVKEHGLQIVSECLMNVAKHAKADKVWVHISEQNNRIQIDIKDNGVGFDINLIGKKTGHYGLLGIYERVRLIGGDIKIDSLSNGTRLQIEAPISEGEKI